MRDDDHINILHEARDIYYGSRLKRLLKKKYKKVIVYLKKVMIKKVIKSCKIYNHINILQEARDIHDVPRLGLKEFIDYSLRILSQSVNIV